MILFEQGLPYWKIVKRYHAHRDTPMMRPTAIGDMKKLQVETSSPAVRARVNKFITLHQPTLVPPSSPNGAGPRYG